MKSLRNNSDLWNLWDHWGLWDMWDLCDILDIWCSWDLCDILDIWCIWDLFDILDIWCIRDLWYLWWKNEIFVTNEITEINKIIEIYFNQNKLPFLWIAYNPVPVHYTFPQQCHYKLVCPLQHLFQYILFDKPINKKGLKC